MKHAVFLSLFLISSFWLRAQSFQQTTGLDDYGPVEGVFVHENIILASVSNKLYRSDDSGLSFTYVPVNGKDVTPRCFAMIDDVIILGGINEDRIYRSLDNGLTWESACNGCPEIFGYPAAVPFTADTLNGSFYMSGTNFIRKSSDLGLTWETMDIDGMCLDISNTGGELWATPGGNLYKSSDEGASWVDVPDDGLFFSNSSQDVLVSEGRIFVATALAAGNGLYVSDDNGSTYSTNGNMSVAESILKVNSTLYVTHFGGLSKSIDNGVSWTLIEGIGGFGPYNGDMAYDGTEKIWFSSGNGLFWYNVNTEEIGSYPFPIGMVTEVSLSDDYTFGTQGGKLFRSANAGNSWENITSKLSSSDVQIRDVYADGQDVYVLANVDFIPTYFSSADEGESFQSITLSGVGYMNQVLSFNPVIIASNNGLFVSSDNGLSFTQANLFDIDGNDVDDKFQAQKLSQNGNSIFASGSKGMAYSHDKGVSWKYISITGIAQFSGWENRLVRNRSNSFPPFVLEESTDGGVTWEAILGIETQYEGPEFMWIMNDTLYTQNDQDAWEQPGQIMSLSETDDEWGTSEAHGVIPSQIISAEATADGRMIFGTREASAWVSFANSSVSVNDLAIQNALVYPNPAEDNIRIKGDEFKKSEAIIYNALGVSVLKFSDTTDMDVSSLKSGVYFIKLQNESGVVKLQFVKR